MLSGRGIRTPWLTGGTLVAMACALGWLSVRAQGSPPPSPWTTDFESASRQAAEQEKQLLLMFSSERCPPCHFLKDNVFPTEAVKKQLENYIPVYFDEEKAEPQFMRFGVMVFPTFVILDPRGDEQERFLFQVSPPSAERDFIERLENGREIFEILNRIAARIELSPEDPRLWKEKADILAANSRFKQAVVAYQEATRLDPADELKLASDIAFLGILNTEFESLDQLESAVEEFSAKFPDSRRIGDTLFVRAILARFRQNQELMLQHLRAYKQQYPAGLFARETAEMLLDFDSPTTATQSTSP